MPQLYQGAPQNSDGRLDKELRCYRFLDKLCIAYSRVDHPAADTMEACRKIEAALGANICKNLFLCNRQQTQFYLLLMPGDKPFKTKELSSQLGVARLSFAGSEFMQKFLDITPGSVSVLGLINDDTNSVQLLIDEDLLNIAELGFHPCVNTSTLKLAATDVLNKILPTLHKTYTVVRLIGN